MFICSVLNVKHNFHTWGRNGIDREVDRLVSMSEYVAYLRYQLATYLFLHGNTSYAMAA